MFNSKDEIQIENILWGLVTILTLSLCMLKVLTGFPIISFHQTSNVFFLKEIVLIICTIPIILCQIFCLVGFIELSFKVYSIMFSFFSLILFTCNN